MANDPNETPFNYDDCVDASSTYVDAVDTATDTFNRLDTDEDVAETL